MERLALFLIIFGLFIVIFVLRSFFKQRLEESKQLINYIRTLNEKDMKDAVDYKDSGFFTGNDIPEELRYKGHGTYKDGLFDTEEDKWFENRLEGVYRGIAADYYPNYLNVRLNPFTTEMDVVDTINTPFIESVADYIYLITSYTYPSQMVFQQCLKNIHPSGKIPLKEYMQLKHQFYNQKSINLICNEFLKQKKILKDALTKAIQRYEEKFDKLDIVSFNQYYNKGYDIGKSCLHEYFAQGMREDPINYGENVNMQFSEYDIVETFTGVMKQVKDFDFYTLKRVAPVATRSIEDGLQQSLANVLTAIKGANIEQTKAILRMSIALINFYSGFLEGLINVNPSDINEKLLPIKKFIQERGIKRLMHFTSGNNLDSIKKYGLLSREVLEKKNIKKHGFNDKKRLDGQLDYISLSITDINYSVYKAFRDNGTLNDAYVIEIDPCVLWQENLDKIYCITNAATKNARKGSSLEDLRVMFADRVNYSVSRYSQVTNRYESKPVNSERTSSTRYNMPTDPQAEILFEKRIDPKYFLKISKYNP